MRGPFWNSGRTGVTGEPVKKDKPYGFVVRDDAFVYAHHLPEEEDEE